MLILPSYYLPVFKDRTERPEMFHDEKDRKSLEHVQRYSEKPRYDFDARRDG